MHNRARLVVWLMTGWLSFGFGVAVAESPHHAELVNPDGSWKYTNALVHETSPYLRQHAHNPVDWKPWGEAAFAEAAERDVPIFLSIGYSTCYWCHVMERQVFENPQIARQMNAQFVCVKVDREERPDVDDIYMTATQLLTGSGGWPMSVFLTPPAPGNIVNDGDTSESDGDNAEEKIRGRGLLPFWAGTYIPPAPAYGRPGFPQVMDAMSQAWATQREDVIGQSERVADAVRQQVAAGEGSGPVTRAMVERVAGQLMQRYDPQHAGFSGPDGPKFPTPSTVALLMDVYASTKDQKLGRAIAHTLDRMARGGMYDQIGGGFHRYSVDEKWLVPHFEKMLYDNGQLLELYAWAHTLTQDRGEKALYARVLRETAEYLLREMRDDSASGGGAFWSAQDAEVNTKEGENYVWTAEQVRAALADQPDAEKLTALALAMYGLDRGTNFKDPHHENAPSVNVIYMPEPMSSMIGFADGDMGGVMRMRERINEALLKVRDLRDQPGTDDKVLVAWNGMAIAGLAAAGQTLNEPRFINAARNAADAILKHMSSPDGGLYRSMRKGEAKIPAFLEDYAFFIGGLLTLDRVLPGNPGNSEYHAEAQRLTAYVQERFARPAGGYYDTLADQADLFVRTRSTYDGALPSGNSQMIQNLMLLTAGDGQDDDAEQAVADLRSFAGPLEQAGMGMTHMLRSAWALHTVGGKNLVDVLEKVEPGVEATGNSKPSIVTVEAAAVEGQANTYRITLDIAAGYHLNANPASAEGLIPTTFAAEGVALDVTYPAAESRHYAFADQPLAVYDGTVEFTLQAVSPIEAVTMTYQACTEEACLAAQTRRIDLP